MNKSTKATLLSAFIFPGAGHFFLKKPIIGSVLIGAAFTALYVLVKNAVVTAQQIAGKIQSGEVSLEAVKITELVSEQATGSEAQTLSIAAAVLTIAWLIGIIDSYRAGRVQDRGIDESG